MAQTYQEGTANTMEAVPVYIKEMMDEIVKSAALTTDLNADSRLARQAQGKNKIEIFTLAMEGLGNYNKTTGYPTGAAVAEWEEYTPDFDRGKEFVLDAVDATDVETTASLMMAEFVRQSVVPEVDCVNLMRPSAAAVTAGNTAAITPAAATFLGQISDAIDAVRDGAKREDGTVVYVNRAYKSILNKSTEVSKVRNVDGGRAAVNTGVQTIDDAKVVYVPDSYMRTAFTAGTNGLTAGGSPVAFLAVAPGCVHGVQVHQAPKIIDKDVAQGVDGYKIDYRIMFDCIVLKNKLGGIYAATVGGGA